ncbi:MAG: hypothetical protein ACI8PW_001412 [Methylophilaceae bacterium]
MDTERDTAYTVTAEVLTGIKKAFDASRVDIPFETQVNLFHNQTEEGDEVMGTRRKDDLRLSDGLLAEVVYGLLSSFACYCFIYYFRCPFVVMTETEHKHESELANARLDVAEDLW